MSNETKHTDGPWKTNGAEIVTADGLLHIASVEKWGEDIPFSVQSEANARLIAQAPTLIGLVRSWLLTDPYGTHSDACRIAIDKVEGRA